MTEIYTYSNFKKLKKGENVATEKVDVFSAKNERVSFQFIIKTDEPLSVEDYSLSLTVKSELFVQKYFHIEKASNQLLSAGDYPDPMLPFALAKKQGLNAVEDEQAFLLELYIPENFKAGKYTEILTLTTTKGVKEIPFALTIFDFALPKQNHCKSLFSIFKDCDWLTGTMEEKHEEYKAYYEMLANYRVSGTYLPTPSIEIDNATIEDCVEAAKKYVDDERVACYALCYKCKRDMVDGQEFTVLDKEYFKNLLIALVNESTNERNLLKNAVLYFATITDEPVPERFPQIKRAYTDVYAIKREVANELDFSEKREVEASLLTMDNIITTFIKEPIYGAVDTWCPTFWGWSKPEHRYEGKALEKLGFKHWFYGCLSPQTPFPVYMIDDELHQIKIVNWMQFDYDVRGNLYWAVNLDYRKSEEHSEVDALNGKEVVADFHGDGFLIYNQNYYGELVPSVRLQAIMEGTQDYEKLLVYKNLVEECSLGYGVSVDCKSILRAYFDKLYDGSVVSEDIPWLLRSEYAVNQLIMLAKKNVVLEKTEVKDGYAYVNVYAPTSLSIRTNGERICDTPLNGGRKTCFRIRMNKKENKFVLYVNGKKYSIYLGDKVKTIELSKLKATGEKISLRKYSGDASVTVMTQPFLNKESDRTQFVYKKKFDATKLDRLYVDATSNSDLACILQADLIDQKGQSFTLGYDMVEEKKRSFFSLQKQWKVIKKLNDADSILEGYRKREEYEKKFAEFDFKNVTEIRFTVLNNTKFLDDHRERLTPCYKFVLNNVYYSEKV